MLRDSNFSAKLKSQPLPPLLYAIVPPNRLFDFQDFFSCASILATVFVYKLGNSLFSFAHDFDDCIELKLRSLF